VSAQGRRRCGREILGGVETSIPVPGPILFLASGKQPRTPEAGRVETMWAGALALHPGGHIPDFFPAPLEERGGSSLVRGPAVRDSPRLPGCLWGRGRDALAHSLTPPLPSLAPDWPLRLVGDVLTRNSVPASSFTGPSSPCISAYWNVSPLTECTGRSALLPRERKSWTSISISTMKAIFLWTTHGRYR